VPYDDSTIRAKVERRRRLLRGRLLSFGITLAVLIAIYAWRHQQLNTFLAGFVTVYALVLVAAVAWVVVYLVGYLIARSELRGVGSGIAVRIGPGGVQVAGLHTGWSEVTSLAAVKGGLGRSPRLRLTTRSGGEASVPFDQLAVLPATLDNTARAVSSGRFGVDLAALGN
jgi:hypothetical protein